jgi:hypothetical protein
VKRTELKEIRELLLAAVAEFGDKGLSSREIIERFRTSHQRELTPVSDALWDIALIKLLGDVSNRRPHSSIAPGQGDLFAGYSVPTAVSIPLPGTKEKQRKIFPKLTFAELTAWYKEHAKERLANSKHLAEVKRLLTRIRPYITSADTTIEEALAAYEAEQAKKSKKG